MGAEHRRLQETREGKFPWRKWGPYLSERQWGTVREDYSIKGDAWEYFPHDHARSRAYRWGEDGIAGICDSDQRLCLAISLWNGRDPILKERLFGLTNGEGNHVEDVKEIYYYLDATPTHSYLKMLYKYPQRAFPYAQLVEQSRNRGKHDAEFELIDTGAFDEDRYFDVLVEYAKADADDVLMLVTIHNCGPEPAEIHVLPQIWYRNTWSWKADAMRPPDLAADNGIVSDHPKLGRYVLHADGAPTLLFCNNETNTPRIFQQQGPKGSYKDAFHEYVVHGRQDAISPSQTGTKAAVYYRQVIPAHESVQFRLRLTNKLNTTPFDEFDSIFKMRRDEADDFYAEIQHGILDDDVRRVQRQAFAGMIWSKQFYYYHVPDWLQGDAGQPPPPRRRRRGRNNTWQHVNNAEVISMPDKWEYPWYAAWDLAFHCIPFAMIDAEFAKDQLILLTREWYMHPNGQIPAYEWEFSNVNPPVHAWAAWRVFQIDRKKQGGNGDLEFLERVFHKLILNFTWWVNRKDSVGRNIFQGGFLGLDNIGIFDRTEPLLNEGRIDQADGTSWMAMYCLNLMRIALELSVHNRVYEDIATKFFQHFLGIAKAMTRIGSNPSDDEEGGAGLWDDADKFFYDKLILSDGGVRDLKIRSMVGLIPLFAVEILEPEALEKLPEFKRRLAWIMNHRPDLAKLVSRWEEPGRGERRLLSLLRGHRMKRLIARMLDETEFLSDYGVRSLSKAHQDHPYTFSVAGTHYSLAYEPAESKSGLFGGNSNWRGPIWFPMNFLLIESLQKFHHYYGDDFKVECPTRSGIYLTLGQVADELTRRLTRIFVRDDADRRAVFGSNKRLQNDPHFRDHLLFYEYFHGDDGSGVGASHQTGWTGLVAKLMQPRKEELPEERSRRVAGRNDKAIDL